MKRLQDITGALSVKILFILILLAILGFFTMEFVFKLQPCELCKLQRIPYFIALVLCALCFVRLINPNITLILLLMCFFVAFCLGIFHLLVEEGVFSFNCTNVIIFDNIEDLKRAIYAKGASCNIKSKFFGLRVSMLSILYSIFLLSVSLFCFFVNKNTK